MRYVHIPTSAFESENDHDLFQACYEHISSLLGEQWFPTSNATSLDGIAEEALTVWRLWWFAAEVAGNGMSAWVLNCPPHAREIIDSHAALARVGATELVRLLEASIPLAANNEAEFTREPERDWFAQFPMDAALVDMESIDSKSFDLAGGKLSSLVAEYMRKNRDRF